MTLLIVLLIIYVLANLIFYMISRFYYAVLSTLLRKGLYTLFIVGILWAYLNGQLDYLDWKIILQMVAAVIFVDLSIFQTPNILKIWSAEFQYGDAIVDNIKKNEARIQYMNRKLNVYSKIIQVAEDDLNPMPAAATEVIYERELRKFLEKYTNEFDFSLRFHFLPDDMDQEDTVKESIVTALDRIENLFNVTVGNKGDVTNSLFDAKTYAFDSEQLAVIPIYGGSRNFLIILSAKEGSVIEVDLMNIINLVTIFNWSA